MTPSRGVRWVVEAREPGGAWQWDRTAVCGSLAEAKAKRARLRRWDRISEYRIVRYVREEPQP